MTHLPTMTNLLTYVWYNDSQFWVECVINFADCSFVTPERVIILTVLGVRVTDCGEHLVPGGGVGVGLRYAVWRLPVKKTQGYGWLMLHSWFLSGHKW